MKNFYELQLGALKYFITDKSFRYQNIHFFDSTIISDKFLKELYNIVNSLLKDDDSNITFDDLKLYIKENIRSEEKRQNLLVCLQKVQEIDLSKKYVEDELRAIYLNSQLNRLQEDLLFVENPFKKLGILMERTNKLYEKIYNVDFREVWDNEKLKKVLEQVLEPPNIYLAIDGLEKYLGGIKAGDVGIVAGYTSVGKTWFLLESFLQSVKRGKNIVFFTLELTKEQLLPRLIVLFYKKPLKFNVNISYYDLLSNDIESVEEHSLLEQRNEFDEFVNFLNTTNIIEPMDVFSVDMIKQEVLRIEYVTGRKVDGIIIDGIEHIRAGNRKFDDLWKTTAYAIKELKDYARAKKIAVLTMCQIQKTKENKELLTMRDLAGGAEISRVASLVLTLNQTDAEYKCKCMRLFVAKQREGYHKHLLFAFNSLFSVGRLDNLLLIKDNKQFLSKVNSVYETNREVFDNDLFESEREVLSEEDRLVANIEENQEDVDDVPF